MGDKQFGIDNDRLAQYAKIKTIVNKGVEWQLLLVVETSLGAFKRRKAEWRDRRLHGHASYSNQRNGSSKLASQLASIPDYNQRLSSSRLRNPSSEEELYDTLKGKGSNFWRRNGLTFLYN